MSLSDKQRIIDWFYRAEARHGVFDFTDVLAAAASPALNLDASETAAFVTMNVNRFWGILRSEQDARTSQGVNPIFEFIEDVRKCRWQSMAPSVGSGEMRRRLRLQSRPAIITTIDGLNWREFEALGCVVVQLCGSTQVFLTPPGNECGVDFFATLTVNGNNHVFSGSRTQIRVVGQSKKYESRVDTDKIKSFNETLTDIKKREPKITALVPAWFQAARGPIVGWMIAHRGFKSGARARAHNHGIVLSDTIDLAEISALSRQLNETATPSQRATALKSRGAALL